jgi:hypothetical protein
MDDTTATDGPEPELYEVDAERYTAAINRQLGTDISPDAFHDLIEVDARGYAPDVAAEVGEHYMAEHIEVFSPEQAAADVLYTELSFVDDLVDQIYDAERFLSYAEREQPLSFAIETEEGEYSFESVATLLTEDLLQDLERVDGLKEQLEDLHESELRDEETRDELYAEASELHGRFGDLRDIDASDTNSTFGSASVDRFAFNLPDVTGYAFTGSETVCVYEEVDGRGYVSHPFSPQTVIDPVHLPGDAERVIERLYRNGEFEIDEERAKRRRQEIAQEVFAENGIDVEPGTFDFLRKAEELEDEMPPEREALKELAADNDVSLEYAPDRAKLDYLVGTNPIATDLLTTVQQLRDDIELAELPAAEDEEDEPVDRETDTEPDEGETGTASMTTGPVEKEMPEEGSDDAGLDMEDVRDTVWDDDTSSIGRPYSSTDRIEVPEFDMGAYDQEAEHNREEINRLIQEVLDDTDDDDDGYY